MEREAIACAEERIADDFARAVEMIAGSAGRVIVAGLGKSGLIGRKIAATLTSTGTPAAFLHPAEAAHGDLGMVGASDVAILVSKNGESDELIALLDQLKRLGVPVIALTGSPRSTMASHADVVLDASVAEEACPHGLAPTTSTTVALALGDALSVALLEEKGFQASDFARLHPGGSLGRKMLTRVRDVMVGDNLRVLSREATMREAVVQLAECRGIAIVADDNRVVGVVTSGDLARLMEREEHILAVPVATVMTSTPRTAAPDELGSAVLYRMERDGIMAMPVVDEGRILCGIVHLHDLMRAGVA